MVKSIAVFISTVFISGFVLQQRCFLFFFYIRRIKWKWKHTHHLRFRWNFYLLQVCNFLYLFSNFKKVDYNKKHNLFKAKEHVLYLRRIVQSKLKQWTKEHEVFN